MSPVEGATPDYEGSGETLTEGVGKGKGRDVLGDAIEGFSQEQPLADDWDGSRSSVGSRSDEEPEQMGTDEERPSPHEREVKRRKLSITPLPAFSSPIPTRSVDVTRRTDYIEEPLGSDQDGSQASSSSQLASSPSRPDHAQPTFRPAPRFKPLEDDIPAEGLPSAFSPQRRGQKYLHGGLAAELQGWLSDIRKADNIANSQEETKVEVSEVRSGGRMYLVRGKRGEMIILAGEGRLTGLGRRAVVGVGSLVLLGRLVWDVRIEEETWIVACDWSIL